jgi:hypothetical protein
MNMRILACVSACLVVCGCASVVRGTTETVTVQSEPSDASIRTSLGHSCPMSPCTFEVSRKTELTAYAEKSGYKPGSIFIGTKFSGGGAAGLAGNVVLGGVIGVGVDAATGATLDHYPNPATINLVPADSEGESTKAVIPPKRPPAKAKSAHTS